MAFEPKKYSDIYEDMRGKMAGVLTDFEVGSVARTMFESFAYEIGTLYQQMHLVYLSGFVDTAEDAHLDNVVAVLGIERGSPDYAVGKVTFTSDKGNLDITIPIGTLVATEERNGKPKQVYATVESAELNKTIQSVEVKVKALERGDEMDADPGSIVVMPRPIAGVKAVNNAEPVRLIGRRRETDEELRRRAKNALLSSGKANIAAIENAVLALSGVLDVKVIEFFNEKPPRYGVIDVVVDSPNFQEIRNSVAVAVEQVRAAGIYANIKQAQKIEVSGTITITPYEANLIADEKENLAKRVRLAFADLLRELRMGQTLLASKIITALSLVNGVEDVKLALKIKKGTTITNFVDRMEAASTERFFAGENGSLLTVTIKD